MSDIETWPQTPSLTPNAFLVALAARLDTIPEVPHGEWFKRFPSMLVCGEGELVKTFLVSGQSPHGQEVI